MDNNDKIIPDDKVIVQKDVIQTGKTEFATRAAIAGKTPANVKRVVLAIQKTMLGLTGAVSGTDLFTGYQSKVIIFCFVAIAVLAEGWGKLSGVTDDK